MNNSSGLGKINMYVIINLCQKLQKNKIKLNRMRSRCSVQCLATVRVWQTLIFESLLQY